MPQAVDNKACDLDQIAERLSDLERRVAALEGHPPALARPPQPNVSFSRSRQDTKSGDVLWGFLPIEMPSGAVPVLGKSVLAIAGAYLLRAIAEAGPIPKLPILIAATAYAALWMVWAVRTHERNRFASATYGVTSVVILAPLLWESTVRFQVITPPFTAVMLAAFIVLALALSWRRRLQLIPWVATLAVVVTTLALIIATRDLVPFTAAMLTVAAVTEIAVCLDHRLSLRAVPALAADFVIWLLTYVMTSAEGVPQDYPPASTSVVGTLSFALLAIYGASISIRVFGQRQRISPFEILQGALAVALATFGILCAYSSAAPLLGAAFLLLAAVSYWGALSLFADESDPRNRRVCAGWAAALLMTGTFLVVSEKLQVPLFCLAALAVAFLYSYTRKFSLGLHTSFYLAAAVALSSLLAFGTNALAGAVPSTANRDVWIIGVAALLCYLVGARVQETRIQQRGLWVLPVALFGFTSAAIVVVTISNFASAQMELTPPRLSVIRTIVNCALALVLGFAGLRWNRAELRWVAYAALGFGTLKLLLEDLRFGNAASLVVSLLCYGSILILLPRLTRQAIAKP